MTNKEIVLKLYDLVKPYRPQLLMTTICLVAVAGLSTAQAYMVKPLLDKIFVEQNQRMLTLLPVALIMLFTVKGFFTFVSSYLIENVGNKTIMELRLRFYRHIVFQPLPFFQKRPTGELISRILNDVGLMQDVVSSVLVTLIRDFFRVFGLLGYIIYQDWKLSILSFVFLPLSIYAITSIGKLYRRYSTKMQQAVAESTTILQETLVGNRIVKAFGAEHYETNRFRIRLEKLFLYAMKDVKLRSFARPLMEVLGGLGIALIMWYGGSQVLKGESTPGTFFSFLAALVMIYEPIKNLSGVNNTIQQGMAATDRVFALFEIQGEENITSHGETISSINNQIEFNQVSFSYDGKKKILKNIDLTVKPGEIIAFVGTSGGGKTTLVNLLPRFYAPTEGSILIDGKDIQKISLKSLRSLIGIVSQETILFNDTVRNNIAYAAPDKTEADIMAAAESAHATEFINELPNGLDTVIGESGSRLSGGQRQRLSIARALLKNAPVLILDEATSALDTESEREVQSALENLMKNRTTFVIAHRLSTIKNANRIIVLQDGQFVEQGDHDELLALEGVYKKLHNMQ